MTIFRPALLMFLTLLTGCLLPCSIPLWGQSSSSDSAQINIDWSTIAPYKVTKTADYTIRVTGVNDLLYQYELTVTLNESSSSDISALASLLSEVTKAFTSSVSGKTIVVGCSLANLLNQASMDAKDVSDRINDMAPAKGADGKHYVSVSLKNSLDKWTLVFESYKKYGPHIDAIKTEMANSKCTDQNQKTEAQKAIDDYNAVSLKVEATNRKATGDHVVVGHAYIDRTRSGTVVVRELYNDSDTTISPKSFPLEARFSVLTASGGFLLTTLQARTYSAQAVPPVPPATTNSTILAVAGASGVRPALVALLNYHDPFPWWLNRPNFGFAISAGPVIEVTNGQADTSRFGFFGGISMHFWHRLFLTPGVHVGEFADFPAGLSQGEVLPPNLGALNPLKRYTAKFGVSITFRGGDPSTLLGNGSKANSNTNPPAPSGVKQP